MNTHEGYSKKKLDNDNVLLAGGGEKSLTEFLGGIRISSSKIQYKAADSAAAWTDLITLVNTDENVKQVDNNNDQNSPILLKNGTGTGTITSSSIFADGITINPKNNVLNVSGYINGKILISGGSYNWYSFQQYDSSDANPSWYDLKSAIININSYSGWLPWIRGVDSEKGSWCIGQYTTNFHVAYIAKANTTNTTTKRWDFGKDGKLTSPDGFVHGGLTPPTGVSKDAYVLLAGGGYKEVSDFATSGHNHDGRYVQDYGSSITVALYDIPTKYVFSGVNVIDGPTTGWISGLVLGSNWNNDHYLHYLVENGSRWYATRSYANSKMKDWNTFAYLTDIKWSLLADKPSTFTPSSHTHPFSQITDGTCTSTASGWSHILSNTYGGSLKSILYMCNGGGYGMHLRGYSTSASVYMLSIYNSSMEVFGVYGDGHSVFGGTVTATHFYEPSDMRLKHDISMISKSVRKFRFNEDNKLYYGFIAQELETLHPELVDNSGEYKKVNYNSAICYYIAELENKVLKLEDEINKLKNK